MIPLPYRDDNPRRGVPVVTLAIIAVNVVAWLYELGHGVTLSTLDYGAIPAWVLHSRQDGFLRLPGVGRVLLHQEVPPPWSVLTSMFLHGSWMHIIGNMWFLWLFGDNVEDAMGPARYAVFYLLCGLAAAATQILATPDSMTPMVGASGAIAGVLGAYFILYPRARVRCIWFLFIVLLPISLPAWILLGLWFLSQFLLPLGAGVAWMAHVGGFVSGILLVAVFARRITPVRRVPALDPPPPRQPPDWY